MANKKAAKNNPTKSQPDKSPKVDPLIDQPFTFTLNGNAHCGKVEARVSPTSYLVRVEPDGYGYVLSCSNMAKLDFVFEPKK
jgi:hypothetical protein